MFCYNKRADAILNIENRVGSLNIGCARGLGDRGFTVEGTRSRCMFWEPEGKRID